MVLPLLLAACNQRDAITLKYALQNIDVAKVVRIETVVGVDPADPRVFFADQPYRSVATGVGYEVADVDQDGRRELHITHDATLGYVFQPGFQFTLLPPADGQAPPLAVTSRAVGTSTNTLGAAMPVKARFGGGVLIDVRIVGETLCSGQVCTGDQACCDGACRRVLTDAQHCGGCGQACGAGETCSGGVCRCGGSACSAGTTCCPGVGCFQLESDPFNCGACGKACNVGETCVSGQCACSSQAGQAACLPGQACCGVTGCGPSCLCGALPCTPPDTCCDGANCVDLMKEDTNCGMCGRTCAPPLKCGAGACRCNGQVCGAGDTCCSKGCANTQDDPSHCGGCGRTCAQGEICKGGRCVCGGTTCDPTQKCCGDTCVDYLSDENNCGACDRECRLNEVCEAGACTCAGGAGCTGNQTCCRDQACFDLSSDPQHCGDCRIACGPQQACVGGMCRQSECNPPCTGGNQCAGGTCTCDGGPACIGGSTCCPGLGCKDLTSDPANCGGCDLRCLSPDLCCSGTCTSQDETNCNACGFNCDISQRCCVCPGGGSRCFGSGPLGSAGPGGEICGCGP